MLLRRTVDAKAEKASAGTKAAKLFKEPDAKSGKGGSAKADKEGKADKGTESAKADKEGKADKESADMSYAAKSDKGTESVKGTEDSKAGKESGDDSSSKGEGKPKESLPHVTIKESKSDKPSGKGHDMSYASSKGAAKTGKEAGEKGESAAKSGKEASEEGESAAKSGKEASEEGGSDAKADKMSSKSIAMAQCAPTVPNPTNANALHYSLLQNSAQR